MGKIYLIRHGETEANKTFQFQGHIDNPLNSKGLCQAAALGQHYGKYCIGRNLFKLHAASQTDCSTFG
ncbi:histidine phosphatase family protein [Phascolarctobacterium faecium]|uniref:histidine phosphatase family protein n=1 Tax=Phascolarctobacterium faecium TaxID=33025 RepID=UPI00352278FF